MLQYNCSSSLLQSPHHRVYSSFAASPHPATFIFEKKSSESGTSAADNSRYRTLSEAPQKWLDSAEIMHQSAESAATDAKFATKRWNPLGKISLMRKRRKLAPEAQESLQETRELHVSVLPESDALQVDVLVRRGARNDTRGASDVYARNGAKSLSQRIQYHEASSPHIILTHFENHLKRNLQHNVLRRVRSHERYAQLLEEVEQQLRGFSPMEDKNRSIVVDLPEPLIPLMQQGATTDLQLHRGCALVLDGKLLNEWMHYSAECLRRACTSAIVQDDVDRVVLHDNLERYQFVRETINDCLRNLAPNATWTSRRAPKEVESPGFVEVEKHKKRWGLRSLLRLGCFVGV